VLSPEEIEAKFSGAGLGRKNVSKICLEIGVDLKIGLGRLSKAGISARGDDKLRPLAEKYDRNPMDLLKIMMIP